jgi:lycopene cyclase domain-containing protein
MELTYLTFMAVFLLVPIVGLALLGGRPPMSRRDAMGTVILVALALAYTAPWDQHLIRRGVWGYAVGAVALRFGSIPIEELLFMTLQPVLAGLWLARFDDDTADVAGRIPVGRRAIGVGIAGIVFLAGLALLATPKTFYLGAIIAWGAPILAIQWAFDWPYLLARWRTVAVGVGVPTLYLCVADRIAIHEGIWYFSTRYTTGLTIGGLPIEEGAFFLATNLFVVQGLVLFRGLMERWN